MILAETVISRPQIGASAGAEVARLYEQFVFEGNDGVVIDLGLGERAALTIPVYNSSSWMSQSGNSDQSVPGERRQG